MSVITLCWPLCTYFFERIEEEGCYLSWLAGVGTWLLLKRPDDRQSLLNERLSKNPLFCSHFFRRLVCVSNAVLNQSGPHCNQLLSQNLALRHCAILLFGAQGKRNIFQLVKGRKSMLWRGGQDDEGKYRIQSKKMRRHFDVSEIMDSTLSESYCLF